MRTIRLLAALLVLIAIVQAASADVYVLQSGDGAAALSSVSTVAFLQRFADTGGTPTQTISLSTQSQPFTISGSATSEGFLTSSVDGQYLAAAGYGVGPGTAAIAGTDSTTAPREVARIAVSSGAVDISTVFSGDTTFSTANIRSAVSNDGGQFWLTGSKQGVRYGTLGASTSTLVSDSVTNTRVARIFEGQLYVSSGSGSFVGINTVGTGLPTGEGETTTNLFTTTGSGTGTVSPYDFFRKDANTFYVTDDRTAVNGGGIQKWEFNTDTSMWGLTATFPLGVAGARGLAGTIVEGNAVLYATSAESNNNHLFTLVDTGIASVATSIADAGAMKAFRGVAFVSDVVVPTNNSDFNNDGTVDGADFLIWQQNNGEAALPGDKSTGDANGDLAVDGDDLGEWQDHFGGAPRWLRPQEYPSRRPWSPGCWRAPRCWRCVDARRRRRGCQIHRPRRFRLTWARARSLHARAFPCA